jgi:flagellar basal body rod protein FlgC
MFDALNIAGSGLDAASTILSVAAKNMANLNTPGYATETALVGDVPGGEGVEVVRVVVNVPEAASGGGGPGVDAVAQAIEIRKAQVLYAANAAVIRSQEQMFGSLIDVLDTQANPPPSADNVQ